MITVQEANVHVYRTTGTSDEQASALKDVFTDQVATGVCVWCFPPQSSYTLPSPALTFHPAAVCAVCTPSPGVRNEAQPVLDQQHQLGPHHGAIYLLRVGLPGSTQQSRRRRCRQRRRQQQQK
jgi:hypothetical protein